MQLQGGHEPAFSGPRENVSDGQLEKSGFAVQYR